MYNMGSLHQTYMGQSIYYIRYSSYLWIFFNYVDFI